MFLESFTASAERALKRADLLAKRQNASVVEPLDLLAALAAESESRACGAAGGARRRDGSSLGRTRPRGFGGRGGIGAS